MIKYIIININYIPTFFKINRVKNREQKRGAKFEWFILKFQKREKEAFNELCIDIDKEKNIRKIIIKV